MTAALNNTFQVPRLNLEAYEKFLHEQGLIFFRPDGNYSSAPSQTLTHRKWEKLESGRWRVYVDCGGVKLDLGYVVKLGSPRRLARDRSAYENEQRNLALFKELGISGVPELEEVASVDTTNYYIKVKFAGKCCLDFLDELTTERIKSITRDVIVTLKEVREKAGVFHGDLKPDQIILNALGKTTLVDWESGYDPRKANLKNLFGFLLPEFTPWEVIFSIRLDDPDLYFQRDAYSIGASLLALYTQTSLPLNFDLQSPVGILSYLHGLQKVLGPFPSFVWTALSAKYPALVHQTADGYELAEIDMTVIEKLPTMEEMVDQAAVTRRDSEEEVTYIKELLRGLLDYDPSKRWTLEKALTADFFRLELPVDIASIEQVSKEVFEQSLEKLGLISAGQFCVSDKVVNLKFKEFFKIEDRCVKFLLTSQENLREATLLTQLKEDNLSAAPQLIEELFSCDGRSALIFQDVGRPLSNQQKSLSMSDMVKIFSPVITALMLLHEKEILHGDVNETTITEKGCLIDWGRYATVSDVRGMWESPFARVSYLPAEVLLDIRYINSSEILSRDQFGLGAALYFAYTGKSFNRFPKNVYLFEWMSYNYKLAYLHILEAFLGPFPGGFYRLLKDVRFRGKAFVENGNQLAQPSKRYIKHIEPVQSLEKEIEAARKTRGDTEEAAQSLIQMIKGLMAHDPAERTSFEIVLKQLQGMVL